MLNLRPFIATLAVGACVTAANMPNTSFAEETWQAYIYNAVTTTVAARGFLQIAERIEEETDGEITVEVHIGGTLPIKVSNISQAVSDGVIQIADDGFFIGNVPISGVMRLPMLISNEEEYEIARKIMAPYIEAGFEKQGVIVLGEYRYPLQVAWSKKKLASLADIEGQKLRVTSPEQGEFVRRFGGTPVSIGAPEVPPALERGVVDGVFTASSGGGKIWRDLLGYNYRFGPNYFNSFIIVNKATFEGLSAETQTTIQKIVDEVTPWMTAEMIKEEGQITDELAKEGMTVTELKSKDLEIGAETMDSYWDEWAESHGPKAIEALAKVRQALGK